jgi:hypothetical protein
MKRSLLILFCAVLLSASTHYSQGPNTAATPSRPRVVGATPTPEESPNKPSKVVVVTNTLPAPSPIATPRPIVTPQPTPIVVGSSTPSPNSTLWTAGTVANGSRILGFGQLRLKIAEARREMATRPTTIAMTDTVPGSEAVRVAFFDWDTQMIDYLSLSKDSFLTKEGEFVLTSEKLKSMKIRIIRPNGVNTPIFLSDLTGKAHLPLMVQYPVVRNGVFHETAYYMSTHPGLVTPEVVNAGKFYVRNTIDIAREKLRQKGVFISPKVADIGERLSIVEHVDHYRFRNEYHPNIYNDIFTLYALNEGQTYRYSVSSAGAGGMVQMIPSTYQMMRAKYPSVGLMPDFVEGMRNHVNASQAMLLYIQMTYNDLMASPTVADALGNGLATELELLSAGYNSNPAKLPGYIKRGGANWRNLIPRETQIYLQINASMDRFVPIVPRTK